MVLRIYGKDIEPGTRHFCRLRVAQLLDGNELSIPLHVIRGREDGPTLGLFASIHGSEYYSNRIIRRIVNDADPHGMSGTILAVPVANPSAFSHMTRQTPDPPEETVDFANLNRVFPGKRIAPLFGSMESTDVSLTMRMASIITDEVLRKCNYVLDYHGQMRGMALKKMLYNRASDESMELSRIFGLGIIHDPIGESGPVKGVLSPCTDYAESIGMPGIVPEIGGGGHSEAFEAECERIGVQGARNVMVHLGMMEGELVLPDRQFFFRRAPHLRATVGGYLVSDMEPEDVGIGRPTREVRRGEVLGTIYDPYTLKELEQLKAPADGLLYACRVSGPIEAQGEALAVADFEDSKWME
jgi:hypothetical protein